ncbi:MAG TPA: hypothetical protein VMV56_09635 [Williamwhitmania sp.]|nr:hypothetical protein [Williamwhitmania sp.]
MDIKETSTSQLDYFYTLYPVGITDKLEEYGHTRQYEMQVKYITKDDDERDTKFEAFRSLRVSLDGSGLILINDAKFQTEKITNQTSIGTFQFFLIE